MAKRGRRRGTRQVDGAPPVVEDPKLPRMGEGEIAPRRVGRRIVLMTDDPKPDTGKRNRMEPVPRGARREPRPRKEPLPEQEAPRSTRPPDESAGPRDDGRGYLRLRVLVSDGELSLAGGKFVEGPLVETERLHPGLAYEATLGERRIAVGEIPDAGVWRSFPDPEGRRAMQGHHITTLSRYEIAVRIRVRELSLSALPRVQVTLYRWGEPGPSAPIAPGPLKRQFGRRLREVGTLKGLQLEQLPRQAQAALRRALR